MVTDRDMEPPNRALLRSMRFLLLNLGEVPSARQDKASLGIITTNLEKKRGYLGSIRTNLEKLSEVYNHPLTVNYWKKDVRELSYDMEDFVDQLVHRMGVDSEMGCVDEILKSFKARIEELEERYERYNLEEVLGHITNTVESSHRGVGRKRDPGDLVGMNDGPANDILRWLKAKGEIEKELKVGSILGTEGVGKSTLAQMLWRDRELEREFDCRAFVQTAKKPDMRLILRSILSQVRPEQPPEGCQVSNLVHDIRKHLQDKRYLIIIDDLWAVSVWDVISRAFPEGNCCNRILTTTTIEDVAMACCNYDTEHIFNLKPPSADHSKKLFTDAVFGPGNGCPKKFNDFADEIPSKCGGLPLAIICIGNLIASQQDGALQLQLCERIEKTLHPSFETSSNPVEILNEVLELYYRSLPYYLKSCLLYLSIYPENYLILKEDLVKQWIAEDFFSAKEDKIEVSSSYFDELVSIGLIQRVPTNSNKKQVLYAVHPTVFDFISRKAMEGNFITIIDYSQLTVELTDKIRRLSLHFGSATYATPPTSSTGLSQVRSLTFMGLLNCMPSLVEFRLIRVVILHLRSDDGDTKFSLAEIDKLLLLRYLQVGCNVVVELPDHMQCLKHLETLEINAEVAAVPSDIAHVPRLWDVCMGGKKIHAHLSPVASGKAIGMDDSSSASTPSIQIFELLPPVCIFSRIPEWIAQLHKLHVLEIVVRELQSNDINVLAELPMLTALSLYVRRPTEGHIVCSRGAFPALEYLKLVCGVLFLNFQKDTMPNLRRLKIGFNAHRGVKYGHILQGIQHLLNLEEIAASTGKASCAEESDRIAAESELRDAISSHPSRLSFKIERVDPVDEEYDHSGMQDYCSQETEQRVIREDEMPIKEPRDLLDAKGATPQKIKRFTEDEIEGITNYYGTLIGEGGFGQVYKGVLDDDNDLVAVKVIRKNLRNEFMEEVKIHSQMRHKNLVKLIGYCVGESTLKLVTEYVPKGNLDDMLHNSNTEIPLDIRLGIGIGCAEALSYVHSMHLSNKDLVCHGDIKPANILLDDNFTAKVSDFGLSRLLSDGIAQYASKVMGSSNDYMDPLLMHTGRLTPRNDVYSFGIVLLELVTRKRVTTCDINLIGNLECAKGKGLRKLFDESIANKNTFKILEEMVELAMACLRLDIKIRPEMNHVENCLRVLKRDLKCKQGDLKCRQEHASYQSILAAHHAWHGNGKQENAQLKKSGSFFKRTATNAKIISEFSNLRSFKKAELKEITDNYSYILSRGMTAKFYKGRLEDNTVVAVRKFCDTDSQEAFIKGGIMLSHIAHNNIIKLLGCCLEAETPAFIYEYADKGSLLDVLTSQEYLSLDLRLRIAIRTAEALQYLHSSAAGIIGHGNVEASTILLDNKFMPKLTHFSGACKLIMHSGSNGGDSVISSNFLEKVLCNDPSRYRSVLMNLERDVYRFGGVLLALISWENSIGFDNLIVTFIKAYQKDNSGKAMFDKDITSEHDIAVLEEIGRLAMKCTILNLEDMVMRPTMHEVVEQLRRIRRHWKLCTTEAAPHVTETMATAVAPSLEPRLPNLMRHLFGYRRISSADPIFTS